MREIKFRAFHEEGGDMVYFDNRKLTMDQYQLAHLAMLLAGDYGDVLMQYTGLNDKNGKEIYEGDIVFLDSDYGEDICGVIEYFAESASYALHGINSGSWVWIEFKGECYEVIGNIHENPDLIP